MTYRIGGEGRSTVTTVSLGRYDAAVGVISTTLRYDLCWPNAPGNCGSYEGIDEQEGNCNDKQMSHLLRALFSDSLVGSSGT